MPEFSSFGSPKIATAVTLNMSLLELWQWPCVCSSVWSEAAGSRARACDPLRSEHGIMGVSNGGGWRGGREEPAKAKVSRVS